jgi:hypothetical protein
MRRKLVMKTRTTVYVTRETESRRLLLTPGEPLEERILGVLGRARRLYPVDLHGFTFLADRIELLMTVSTRPRLAGFLAHLYRNVSIATAEVRGWQGGIFAGRGTTERVETAAQARTRMRDVHAGAVRRGLVGKPEEWPGVSSASALLGGIELVGVWNGQPNHVPIAPLPARLGGAVAIDPLFDEIIAEGMQRRGAQRPFGRHWIKACEPTLPDPRDPGFERVIDEDERAPRLARVGAR